MKICPCKAVQVLMVIVYFPQRLERKEMIWQSLLQLFQKNEGEIVVMGDFNEVRDYSERFDSIFLCLFFGCF